MAAKDFAWYPTWVKPEKIDFVVDIAKCENFTMDYQLIDADELIQYHLMFDGVTDSNRNLILAHYASSATGPYEFFNWTTVPSYLNDGAAMNVRYVRNSYKEEAMPRYWKIECSFEKEV